MKRIVIVGGGIAGLSALNRLLDLGISATLVEGGSYPAHKVCGEFFSPECLSILAAWHLEPITEIGRISIITDTDTLSFSLPTPARSQSRFDFDLRLVKRAQEQGARVITKTKVKEIEKTSVILDSGETLSYTDLIISTGRLFGASSPCYSGFKGHMREIEIINHLEMYPFLGGYAGLSSIGDGLSNLTCLMDINVYKGDEPLQSLFQAAPHLKKRLEGGSLVFDNWLTCQVPAFGIKKTPSWPNTYFIGDAAGTIPPASGLGLSLAITSGHMAAEYALRGDYISFQKAWHKRYRRIFTYGHLLHRLFLSPRLMNYGAFLGDLFPQLPLALFTKMRIKSL